MEAAVLVSPSVNCSVREIIVLYLVFCLVSLAVKFSLKLSTSSSSSSEVLVVSAGEVGFGEVFSDSKPFSGVSGLVTSAGVNTGTNGAIPVSEQVDHSLS